MRTSGGKVNTCRRVLKPPTSSQADDLPKTGALSMLSTYDVENSMEQISLKSFPGIRFFVESDFPLTLNSLRTNQPKNNDIRT